MIDSYEANKLNEALENIANRTANDRVGMVGQVLGTDENGVTWVHVLGGTERTPLASTTAQLSEGDIVDVTIGGGRAIVRGNLSDPAAGTVQVEQIENSVKEVEEVADTAAVDAKAAQRLAKDAQDRAAEIGSAISDANGRLDEQAAQLASAVEDIENTQADIASYKQTAQATYATKTELDDETGAIKRNIEATYATKDETATLASKREVQDSIDGLTSTYETRFSNLQAQVDGQVEVWYKTVDPTTSNAPASTWKTEEEKKRHEGDLYYNTQNGHAWRWMKDGNTWKWLQIPDSDAAAALAAANQAKDGITEIKRDYVTKSTFEQNDTEIRQSVSDSLSSAKTYTDGKITTEVTERNAAIETAASGIRLTAESALSTANAAKSSIDNLDLSKYTQRNEFSVAPDKIASTVSDALTSAKGYTDTRETAIKQYADSVSLSAEARTANCPNLTPWFSHPLTDVYNATSNPGGYWFLIHFVTKLEDGWAHFSFDNTSGTSMSYRHGNPVSSDVLKAGTQYTVLVELRNITVTGNVYVRCPDSRQLRKPNGGATGATDWKVSSATEEFRIPVEALAKESAPSGLGFCIRMDVGSSASFDIRVSLYESPIIDGKVVTYAGPYKPYVSDPASLYEAQAAIKVNQTNIENEVTARKSTDSNVYGLSSRVTQTESDITSLFANSSAGLDIRYYSHTSATSAPADSAAWQEAMPARTANKYIWMWVRKYTYDTSTKKTKLASSTKTCISGVDGANGANGTNGTNGTAGGRWYSGTGITGTSTTASVFSGSGVSSAVVGDMYLNTSTWNTYRCTTAGAASAAKWVYVNNIKGAKGDQGAQGAKGETGAQGDKGDKGDTGAKGADGSMIRAVSTTAVGTAAKVATANAKPTLADGTVISCLFSPANVNPGNPAISGTAGVTLNVSSSGAKPLVAFDQQVSAAGLYRLKTGVFLTLVYSSSASYYAYASGAYATSKTTGGVWVVADAAAIVAYERENSQGLAVGTNYNYGYSQVMNSGGFKVMKKATQTAAEDPANDTSLAELLDGTIRLGKLADYHYYGTSTTMGIYPEGNNTAANAVFYVNNTPSVRIGQNAKAHVLTDANKITMYKSNGSTVSAQIGSKVANSSSTDGVYVPSGTVQANSLQAESGVDSNTFSLPAYNTIISAYEDGIEIRPGSIEYNQDGTIENMYISGVKRLTHDADNLSLTIDNEASGTLHHSSTFKFTSAGNLSATSITSNTMYGRYINSNNHVSEFTTAGNLTLPQAQSSIVYTGSTFTEDTPSSNLYQGGLFILDNARSNCAYFRGLHQANGNRGLQLEARRSVSGAHKYNTLNLTLDTSGNAVVSLGGTNVAAAWRSAIGANNAANITSGTLPIARGGTGATGVTNTTSGRVTASSGYTIVEQSMTQWGKVVTLRLRVTSTAATSGTRQVATVASGYRPTYTTVGQDWEPARACYVGADGKVYIKGAMNAGVTEIMSFMYLIP